MPGILPTPGVFGLPVGIAPLGPLGASGWDTTGSGNPRAYNTLLPFPSGLLFLASASNQFLPTNVFGNGCTWMNAGNAALSSGNYAEASLWVGWANGFITSLVTNVLWEGLNSNGIAVAHFAWPPSRRPRILGAATATHSGSGSLVVGPVTPQRTALAVACAQARNGSLTASAGWLPINTGNVSGPTAMIYQIVNAGTSVSITWTGPTDNSAGVIALVG